MRVHLVSNVCNNHYVIAKFLRRIGVDAHLYYPEWGDFQMQPESEDPEIRDHRPDWLHPYGPAQIGRAAHVAIPETFRKELFACDVLHVHDLLPLLWAADSGRPYVWHPFGTDIYILPFLRAHRDANVEAPDWMISALGCRDAIAGCSAVITEWWFDAWKPGYALLRTLDAFKRIALIPHIAINTERFSPAADVSPRASLLKSHAIPDDSELLIFHPTRQLISPKSDAYFANERLYEALGALKRRGLKFRLVIVEKGGVDEPIAREIIRNLGIAEQVSWVPMMPRHCLVDWYRAADITAAELTGGSVGAVGFEAMACGSALLGNFYLQHNDPLFWPPPIVPPMLNVQTTADIEAQVWDYAHRRDDLRSLGRQGRDWVQKHMSAETIARQCLDLYERVLANTSTGYACKAPGTAHATLATDRDLLAAALDEETRDFAPADAAGQAAVRLALHYARQSAMTRERAGSERAAFAERDSRMGYHLRRAVVLAAQRLGLKERKEPA